MSKKSDKGPSSLMVSYFQNIETLQIDNLLKNQMLMEVKSEMSNYRDDQGNERPEVAAKVMSILEYGIDDLIHDTEDLMNFAGSIHCVKNYINQ